jgi:predicted dehydrogenase
VVPFTRRRLIASTAAAGAAAFASSVARGAENEPPELRGSVSADSVSLPPLHAPTELEGGVQNLDPPGRRLGVAVVGLGHHAREEILPGFGQAKHVRLAALVSGEPAKARAVGAQYGIPQASLYDYSTFDRLKDDPAVDIVYVVLPNALHAEYTVRAAAAGKHVLCEKPMATSVAECRTMIEACRRASRKLMIAYRLQYDPLHREVIEMTRSARYGSVRLIEAVNGQNDAPNGQWRQIKALAGGGSLPDVGLYCLSAFRYLTGEEPIEVMGRTTQPKDDPRFREIEDVCQFTLRFPSGVLATGTCGYSFHESRRFRVNAAEAWFGLDPAFGYDNLAIQVGRKTGKTDSLEQRRGAAHNQFATEMDAFAQSIRQDLVPHTPGEEGLADQAIMAAIYESAAAGHVLSVPRPAGSPSGVDITRGPLPPTM